MAKFPYVLPVLFVTATVRGEVLLDAAAEAARRSGRGELEAASFNVASPSTSDGDEAAGVREGPRSPEEFLGHRLINPYEFIETDGREDDGGERSGRQFQVSGYFAEVRFLGQSRWWWEF